MFMLIVGSTRQYDMRIPHTCLYMTNIAAAGAVDRELGGWIYETRNFEIWNMFFENLKI